MMTRVERITPVDKLDFKTTMLKSCLSDYSDAYIVAKGVITVQNTGTAVSPNNRNKQAVRKIVHHSLIA